jgi:CBS domain-containing protein
MLLKDIFTARAVCCGSDITATAAARLMREHHVGDLLVVSHDDNADQEPIGIVTDRDITIEVLGQERDPAKVRVHEFMRRPVVIGHTSEDTSQILERMKIHGVRRIPVMEGTRLVGIVSLDDLLRQFAIDAGALADVVAREQGREQRTRR